MSNQVNEYPQETYSINFTVTNTDDAMQPSISYTAFYQDAPKVMTVEDIDNLENAMLQNLKLSGNLTLKINHLNKVNPITQVITN